MRKRTPVMLSSLLLTALALPATAQAPAAKPALVFIQMGGNDCPPCVGWRHFELPKLRQSAPFAQIKFFYIDKTINAAVPPAFFLPAELKPYKAVLDEGGSGMHGSPQQVILRDGKVWDYHFGARSADDIVRMLQAGLDGTPSPIPRCERRVNRSSCTTWVE